MSKSAQTIKAFLLVTALSVGFAAPALAVSSNGNGSSNGSTTSNSTTSSQSSQAQSNGNGKLDDSKKQICQQNENRIQNMFTNMNQLGDGQLNLFNNIAEKVQRFYEGSGLSAENYEQLLAQVQQTREAAQNAIQTTARVSSQFGCDKDDPKGTANQFKVQVQTRVQALQQYRTAIKNLVAAIQTAAQNTQENQ